MEIDAILEAIKGWHNASKDVPKMIALFEKGNGFKFTLPDSRPSDSYIHGYLGVVNNELELLLIPSTKDHKKQENIQNYVKQKTVFPEVGPLEKKDGVDPIEARKRIDNWVNHKEQWLASRVENGKELHQVFAMPKRYLNPGITYIAYFALKALGNSTNGQSLDFEGDMIVWDQVNEKIVYPKPDTPGEGYYNTIHLVPPFDPKLQQGPTKEKFYLLERANAIDN